MAEERVAAMANDREKQDIEAKTEAQVIEPAVDDTSVGAGTDALEFVPEGGREAWAVVLGSTLALFASGGNDHCGTFQSIYADFRGVKPNISSYLLAILNAMNVPSRVLRGLPADRYGAHRLVRVASGDYIASITIYTYRARLGSVYIFLAFATLIGTPSAGAILKNSGTVDEAHFTRLIVFSGLLMAGGTLALCCAAVVDAGWVRIGTIGRRRVGGGEDDSEDEQRLA
ncbi:hypothetical protein L227DRAFT_654476 [Lentinus tigrinus ALCF2SS1-6]|uniref:MFS general substrate transporter n=1 Tax=Lentinus tigrinus ALCF2SS1-6 TaxID=1328759 RepID=A0A5C2S4U8_9APHY|nr:hypothetical protein L227DRAFT_654476 [Lentinus tigrinus ALCF2SS1-6]